MDERETLVRRRVTAADEFYDSFATLEASAATVGAAAATVEAFEVLLQRVAIYPGHGETVAGTPARVMKANGSGPFPPLRIFYWFDDFDVYLLDVDSYGEE
jgi:hypothetical protein